MVLNTGLVPMSASLRGVDGAGIVSSMAQWDADETRTWQALQFSGLAALYSARCFLVVSIVPMSEELGWDERQCGIVLSAFYWGYVLTQVVGGSLSDRFGGDMVQWMAGVVWSLATLSSIYLAQVSIWPLVAARFMTGLAQGMHYPAMSSLVACKVPEQSKTKFFGISHSGAYAGAMGVGFLGSLVIRWYHWKALVLLVGCLTLSWTFCLRLFSLAHRNKTNYRLLDGQPSPPTTSRLKLQVQSSGFVASCRQVPWKELLSHSSVIAYLVGFMAECSYAHIIPSWSPTFFSEVFPNQTASAWLYNGAPSLMTALGAYSGGVIINQLILHKYDVTFVRKMGSCVSLLIPGVCLILISAISRGDENFPLTLFLLLLSSYFFGYTPTAISVVCVDLTPTYAGSLYGLANTLGTLPGVFAVPLIGYILHTTGSWPFVFLLQTAILFAGCCVFLACGSSRGLDLPTTATAAAPSN